jgi:hypothetical protein
MHELDPKTMAAQIYKEACGSLMAHTIRGIKNHFYKKGIVLEVLVIRDRQNLVFKTAPNKASVLVTKFFAKHPPDPRDRVRAHIYIRGTANHHLARLCIAHEMFHALLALEAYTAGERKEWDGKWKKEHEPACNKFAQSLCELHNGFNGNQDARVNRVMFPGELFAEGFFLDISDLENLPECLRRSDPE